MGRKSGNGALTMGLGAARQRGAGAKAAIDIEALLFWVYAKQLAAKNESGGVGLHEAERLADGIEWAGSSADGVAAVARIGELGCRVDGGGYTHGDVHPDAETVHQAVCALGELDAGLVIMMASSGRRPECYPEMVAKLVPMRDARGRPIPLRDKSDHVVKGQFKMRWTVRPDVLDNVRAMYTRWHDLLTLLAEGLQGALRDHLPTAPACPRAPWERKALDTTAADA